MTATTDPYLEGIMARTDKSDEATPADPGAIDGLPCVCRFGGQMADGRFDEDMPIRECGLHKALRERVTELEPIVKDGVRRAENCMEWQTRAEAAEARVAELAGALKELLREHECLLISIGNANARVSVWHKKARAILAATPAEALKRARGEDYAAGLEAAAEFHEKYAAKAKHKATGSGVLAQKMSWHNWSAKAIRALGKEGG